MVNKLYIFTLAMVFAIIFGVTSMATPLGAFAVTSGVLEELEGDPSFNADDYPTKAYDYDLYVIQVGESDSRQLYIYCYQPANNSVDLQATSVSISYGFSKDGKGLSPYKYALELVDTEGVFDKYRVAGFDVPSDTERYYNIVAIYRAFNADVDDPIEGGTTDELGIGVGQQWCVTDINGSKSYEMATFNYVDIDIKHSGFITFKNGFQLGTLFRPDEMLQGWYVAFDVENYIVEHIYDADIAFDVRTKSETWGTSGTSNVTYGDWEPKKITLFDTDTLSYSGVGLGGKSYSWNRIMSTDDYIATVDAQDIDWNKTSKDNVKNSQWVFSFYETDYSEDTGWGYITHKGSEVSGITILRLHFMDTRQKIYDLGAVSDVVTPDDIPDAEAGADDGIPDWVKALLTAIITIIIIVAIVIILAVLAPWILSAIGNILIAVVVFVGKGLLWLLKGLWWLISRPFVAFGSLFDK